MTSETDAPPRTNVELCQRVSHFFSRLANRRKQKTDVKVHKKIYILIMKIVMIFLLIQTFSIISCKNDCLLQLKTENQENQPMYFTKKGRNYSFAEPAVRDEEFYVKVQESESLIITCLSTNDVLKKSRLEENITASCKKGKLEITGNFLNIFQSGTKDLSDIKCKEKLKFKITEKKKKCAGDLTQLYEIGIKVLFRSKKVLGVSINLLNQKWLENTEWFRMYSVCFHKYVKEVVYTVHTINGSSIKARQTGNIQSPKFIYKSEYLIEKSEMINPEKAYNLDEMEKGMMDDASFIPFFNYEKKNFVPRPMVPHADMLFFNWKLASYFYINTAPMWRSLERTWENLEKHIRKAASKLQTDLIVYTGVHEKYIINDETVTLDKNRKAISVPFYFWKIVYHEINRSGIAFVMNNDPFEENNRRLCETVDVNVGETWPVYNEVKSLGLLYPCLVDDLRVALQSSYKLPKFKITGELYYP